MLQVNFIRQQPDFVKERLAVKHFSQLNLVDELIALDEKRRKLQFERDELQSRVNSASREIGNLMKSGKREEAEALKAEVAEIKRKMEDTSELSELETSLHQILVQLPNLPSTQVPPGRSAEDNVVVREGGVRPVLREGAVPHWDLVAKYGLIDFE
ncbi:MAG TPA: serine--tRNA ligase, partial [Flavihumibacter sp.]